MGPETKKPSLLIIDHFLQLPCKIHKSTFFLLRWFYAGGRTQAPQIFFQEITHTMYPKLRRSLRLRWCGNKVTTIASIYLKSQVSNWWLCKWDAEIFRHLWTIGCCVTLDDSTGRVNLLSDVECTGQDGTICAGDRQRDSQWLGGVSNERHVWRSRWKKSNEW